MPTKSESNVSAERILEAARSYCSEHGLRLTKGRREVLRLVATANAAVKAYDLLAALTAPGARIMPPVVYRSLDFWIEHGFVHRIESLNAYSACGHPLNNHGCQLLLCTVCGKTVEVCDPRLRGQLANTAEASGFQFEGVVLEIHGRCPECAGC